MERTEEVKGLSVGEWYYRFMGYGGSDSANVCIIAKCAEKTPSGMYSLFGSKGGMRSLPVSDVFIAMDGRGNEYKVSANDLSANGHIGIGTLAEVKCFHRPTIAREEAEMLVEGGKFQKEEVMEEFPEAFMETGAEADVAEGSETPRPMSSNMISMLREVKRYGDARRKREAEERGRKRAEEVKKLRERYAGIIPCPKEDGRYLGTGEVRRNLLAVLKHEFPCVKFSVKTRSGSTSDHATVTWVDGPTPSEVNGIAKQFQSSEIDFHTDSVDTVYTPLSEVCGDFSYVFLQREVSGEVVEYVTKEVESEWPRSGYACEDRRKVAIEQEVRRILGNVSFPVKGYEIVGMKYDDKASWSKILVVKEKAVEPPSPPSGGDGDDGDGATIRRNETRNGIEITFPTIPNSMIRGFMKDNGWRWCSAGKYWYNRFSESNMKVAESIVTLYGSRIRKGAA